MLIEAESGRNDRGNVFTNPNASGGSAVGWLDEVGDGCQVSVMAPSDGVYSMTVGYATTENAAWSVLVNGQRIGQAIFSPGPNGDTYRTTGGMEVTLKTGHNIVRIEKQEGDTGYVDLDYFSLIGPH